MRYFVLILTMTLAFGATSANAKPDTYLCKITKSDGNVFGDDVAFGFDTKREIVKVFDAVVSYHIGSPTDANVLEDTEKKLVITWDVRMRNNQGQITRMAYRAAYFKSNGRFLLNAKPRGYPNSFNARGACSKQSLNIPGLS